MRALRLFRVSHCCSVIKLAALWLAGAVAIPAPTAAAQTTSAGLGQYTGPAPTDWLIASGNQSTCAWHATHGLRCWGHWQHSPPPIPPAGTILHALALGDRYGCYASGPQVTCWGLDWSQPPPRPGHAAPAPRRFSLPADVAQLAAGAFHACALTVSSEVYCWGANEFGQLGYKQAPTAVQTDAAQATTNPDRDSPSYTYPGSRQPAAVALDFTASAISAGLLHTCALGTDGRVRCWGNGSEGQLGNGEHETHPQPQLVMELSQIRTISSGLYHNCAVDRAGKVWCWGNNKFGQLGTGNTHGTAQPVAVTFAAAVQALSSGGYFNCASIQHQNSGRNNAGMACWGWNAQDQLGEQGTGGERSEHGFEMSTKPRTSHLPADFTTWDSGWGHSCAATKNDQLMCWGRNDAGQLGDGGSGSSARPLAVTQFGFSAPPHAPAQAANLQAPGLDVSYHSGPVDWHTLMDSDYRFAFALVSAGVDFRDPMVDAHWAELKQAGFTRGAYHYFVAHDDPHQQAQWFIRNSPLEAGDLAPVVDIESLGHPAPADLSTRLKIFLDTIHTHYGVKPIVYTGPVFWNRYGSEDFGDYPLWVAHYDTPQPTIPQGWQQWMIWQWQANSPLPGVAKADLNRVADHVTLAQLLIPYPGTAGASDQGRP